MHCATGAISTPVLHNVQRTTRPRVSAQAGASAFVPKVHQAFKRSVTMRTPAAKVCPTNCRTWIEYSPLIVDRGVWRRHSAVLASNQTLLARTTFSLSWIA